MSNNSLASLLAWMKDNTRMLGWGMVVALERRKTNLIVLQEYIKRFSESSYLPPIRGDVEIVAGRRMEVIHDYVMDVPVLSFENADLNDSKAMLTMAVAGGSQLTMEKESVGWKVYKVDDIDPLQGPKLYLDLLLNEVPGNVDVDGRVKLDLSKSDNFRLTFAGSQHEQRMGGDFFKDLFNQLPDEKRIYPLGKIDRGSNELMRPKSFVLRTQASAPAAWDASSSEYGEGAILALVRTEGRAGGNFPGENYKYLIPDDAGDGYSATVLFDLNEFVMSFFTKELGGLINNIEFSFERDSGSGQVHLAKAIGGSLTMPEVYVSKNYMDPDYEMGVECTLVCSEMVCEAAGKLFVSVVGNKIDLGWVYSGVGSLRGEARTNPPQVLSLELPFDFELSASYELDSSGGAGFFEKDVNES
jgi:hypothetical protein